MRFLTAVALAVAMLWVPVDGVAQRNPLTGLTTVDVTVTVDWDDSIEGVSETVFTQEVERALELGILRAGLREDSNALNFLRCNINLFSDGGLIIYSREIRLEEMVVPWLTVRDGQVASIDNMAFSATWDVGYIGRVGLDNLDGESQGEGCAEAFELEWRRANN